MGGVRFSKITLAAAAGLASMMQPCWAAVSPQGVVRDTYYCGEMHHELMADFFNFSVNKNDKDIKGSFQKSELQATDCASTITKNLTSLGFQSQAATVNGEVGKFKQVFTRVKEALESGPVSNELLRELIQAELRVVSTLAMTADQVQIASRQKIAKEVVQARKLAVLIEYSNLRYMDWATAPYPLSHDGEPSIDEIARNFSTELSDLKTSPHLTDKQKNTIKSISTRFVFIRDSLINYNKHEVPFVVNLQARAISSLLMDLADSFQSSVSG